MKTVKAISNGYNSEERNSVPYYFKQTLKRSGKNDGRTADFSHYEQKALTNLKK
ncbi:MAG: hypothetical protein K5888_05135 [Lachnospiraceae bacterium]|nr:hypothetical protein [Lachnospiraceae bacterium]